ncbi:histone-lysine N-methyltransferase, H3 lysine-9 specific SUVH5, partial [Selaginella moellendorffii]
NAQNTHSLLEPLVSFPNNFVTDFIYTVCNKHIELPMLNAGSEGCSCKNDCSDTCDCVQKTIASFRTFGKPCSIVYECGPWCSCSSKCCNKSSQRGIQKKLAIFRTEGKGLGLHAEEAISRGSFVCEYVGEVLEDKGSPSTYKFAIGPELVIDAEKYGNVARFVNHSCDGGNVHIECVSYGHHDGRLRHITMFAAKDIAASEELTFDYSGGQTQCSSLSFIQKSAVAFLHGGRRSPAVQ